MRIITSNIIDDSTLTESPVPTTSTLQNLKNYARSSVFTTDSVGTSHTIFSKLNYTKPISAFVIGRHNFPLGLEMEVTMFSTDDWDPLKIVYGPTTHTIEAADVGSSIINWAEFVWAEVVWGEDSAADEFSLKPNYVVWLDNTVVVKSIKIEIFTPTQNVEIGRLIFGDYIEPLYNISYGHEISWTENTKQYRKGGNTLRSSSGFPSKKLSFSLNTIVESDRIKLQDGLRYTGLRKDLFVSLFPMDTDSDKKKHYSGIMKLTKIPSTSEYAPMYYKSKYIMEEV